MLHVLYPVLWGRGFVFYHQKGSLAFQYLTRAGLLSPTVTSLAIAFICLVVAYCYYYYYYYLLY